MRVAANSLHANASSPKPKGHEVTDSTQIAQRSNSLFLKRIADFTEGDIAKALNVAPSTLSERKKHMEFCLQLLAQIGLKVVDAEAQCMPKATYQFLTATHARVVSKQPSLIWDDE
jgi:hypothetical protein